jgi:hypothetical protein
MQRDLRNTRLGIVYHLFTHMVVKVADHIEISEFIVSCMHMISTLARS